MKSINVLCPKCGKMGFLSKRWVESSYYPKYVSYYLIANKYFGGYASQIRGSRFRGKSKKHIIQNTLDEQDKTDKKSFYRITYRRYKHYYIGHYDSEKYRLQMQDYKASLRKSRPNGRKWCHLHVGINIYPFEDYCVAYCQLYLIDGKLSRYSSRIFRRRV